MSDTSSLFTLFGDPWPCCLFPSQFLIVKAMLFLVVMYGCKSWNIKKVEHQRTDSFKLWCQTRLLRVPSAARRQNQSIQKEINTEYSEEGLLLRLKLQYFGHLLRRADSLKKTLMLGKIEGRRKKGGQDEMVGLHHWLKGHELEQVMEDGDGQGSLAWCSPWSHRIRHDWAT